MHPDTRHDHPFSLQEAMQFEPGTITTGESFSDPLSVKAIFISYPVELTEIARLQNSLQHLTSTQSILEEHVATDPDPDLIQALEENRVVMYVTNQPFHPVITVYQCLANRTNRDPSASLRQARCRFSFKYPLRPPHFGPCGNPPITDIPQCNPTS